MGRQRNGEPRRCRDDARQLELLLHDGGKGTSLLPALVDFFAEALDAKVAAHRPQLTADGWASEQSFFSNDPVMRLMSELLDGFLPRAPFRYTHYNGLAIQKEQQNRLLPMAELASVIRTDRPLMATHVYEPAGVMALPHMRVTLTDGPFLLSWLGLWRDTPFAPAEERLVADAIPALVVRLTAERVLWAGAASPFEALGHALELVMRPAFMVNFAGQLVFANELGKTILDRDVSFASEVVAAAQSGTATRRIHSITPVGAEGVARHSIVLASAPSVVVDARLRLVAREQRLTATEARVLAHIVNGDANKDIATKLGSAPRTVEIHVGSIMRKCRVDSRTRLVAWFWTKY